MAGSVRPIWPDRSVPHLRGIFHFERLVGSVPSLQPNTGIGPRDGTDPSHSSKFQNRTHPKGGGVWLAWPWERPHALCVTSCRRGQTGYAREHLLARD
jgi:hypothetical protein